MPCDQISYTTVDIDKMDGPLLVEALHALGYTPTRNGAAIQFGPHRYEAGRLTFRNMNESAQQALVNQIKQAYSTEVVKATAVRFGWALKPTTKNKFAFTATRRS